MEKYFPDWLTVFWNYEVIGQTLGQISTAIIVFFVLLIGVRVIRSVFVRKFSILAARTSSTWDDAVIQVIKEISGVFFLLFALFVTAELFLSPPVFLEKLIRGAFIVSFAYEALKIIQAVVEFGLAKSTLGKNKTSFQGVKLVADIVLWAMGILIVLDNLGFDISTLAASLGIGGIAIALAAQNILGDLFSSFTIYFDKPFQVGDYVVLGTHEGVVKKIGLKTTRVQALSGEELVVSNAELTSTRIQNYKKMKRRRMVLLFGVTYDTKPEVLESIPSVVEGIIENVENVSFDRCHFKSFGSSSLDFECIYHVENGGKLESMKAQQEINFTLFRIFADKGINMAFPTQTVYLKKD